MEDGRAPDDAYTTSSCCEHNLCYMEIWYINLRKSLEIQISLIFSNELLTVSREYTYAAHCMPSF